MRYPPKPAYIKRIHELLNDEEDMKQYFSSLEKESIKSLRVNTLKISVVDLVKRLEKKGWKIIQPYLSFPEIIQVISKLEPGEIGKTIEHLLGYYYVQEITSMMPVIAIAPWKDDVYLDVCASPGSKTTQAASLMHNQGTIIANDLSIGRISILSANLERCGVTNTIVTRHTGDELIKKLIKLRFSFDKILIDAPCSGEGNIRCSPRTCLEWSEGLLKSLSGKQKKIIEYSADLLKEGGELVYSTCTHAPEENEEVVQFLLNKGNLKIIDIKDNLPSEIKTRQGLLEWRGKIFDEYMNKAVRIYPHDNNLEGFFLCKMRKDLKT